MSLSLAQKTAHLKWLKTLRSTRLAAPEVAQETGCDCRAWLKQQTRKQAIHKPRVPEVQPTELLLLASAAPKAQRDGEYNRRFEQGEADWYHVPCASLSRYQEADIQSVAYVAIGTTQSGQSGRVASFLYAVASVARLPRHMLSVAQSGQLVAKDTPYWLFELSHSVPLAQPIIDFPMSFEAKLSVADELRSVHRFSELKDVVKPLG